MVKANDPSGHGISLSLAKRCELLGVHRSGLYYKPVAIASETLRLMHLMDVVHLQHPEFGVRRMTRHLCKHHGVQANRKRIGRLFAVMGIRAISPGPNTSQEDKASYKYPYLLRGLTIGRSNQVWSIDITYIRMPKGYMYLCAIIDIHSRFIVGWSLSNTMEAGWVCSAARAAFERYGRPEILNSDQGSQFTGDEWTKLLKDNDVTISMDGKGRATDNAFIERFWRTLKYEYAFLNPDQSGLELYQGIAQWISYYNNERMHSKLAYKSPASVYENAAYKMAA